MAYLLGPGDIPKCIERILCETSSTADPPRCSQCRTLPMEDASTREMKTMLRCSQCQAARYCSRRCQKRHYKFHKQSCQTVASLRAQAKTEPDGNTHLQLAQVLITMGYRETDTVHNGRFYYRPALQAWMEAWTSFGPRRFFNDHLEDVLLILLAILRVDRKTLAEWCLASNSPRQQRYDDLEADDFPLQMARLLQSMHALAEYRREQAVLADLETSPSNPLPQVACGCIGSYLSGQGTLVEDIQSLIRGMQRHGHGRVLRHLRDTIPFGPDQAPNLIRMQGAPYEMWSLCQDSIFTTPGVNDILHDFLPEEDDPLEDDDDETMSVEAHGRVSREISNVLDDVVEGMIH